VLTTLVRSSDRDVRPADDEGIEPQPSPVRPGWPRWSLELVWVLYGLSLAAAAAFSAAALTQATDVAGAMRAAGPLLLAAGTAIAGGQLAGSDPDPAHRHRRGTLAIIIAITRVDAVADWPNHTLMLSAALGAAARAAGRRAAEPQRPGLLLAALLTRLGHGRGRPLRRRRHRGGDRAGRRHAPDLGRRRGRLRRAAFGDERAGAHDGNPARGGGGRGHAPPAGGGDAIVVGGFLVVLALPGTGVVPWWLIPLVSMAGATLATFAALLARRWQSALLGVGVSALLGLFAALTGLATPGLTAATFTVGALLGAATAVVAYGWPLRFGPYLDRVADVASGGAVLAFPVAVTTFAYVVGTPDRALARDRPARHGDQRRVAPCPQVASPVRRTVTAAAAIATTVGGFSLWVTLPGFNGTDLALVALLFLTAVAATGSRAFEIAADSSAILNAVRSAPQAAGALADALDGCRRGRRRQRAPAGPGTARPHPVSSTTSPFRSRRDRGTGLALAHAVGVLVHGVDLVLTAAMVIVIALLVQVLPEQWRRGAAPGRRAAGRHRRVSPRPASPSARRPPRSGRRRRGGGADLTAWTGTVTAWVPFGAQVPATLLLAAAAGWILLSEPAAQPRLVRRAVPRRPRRTGRVRAGLVESHRDRRGAGSGRGHRCGHHRRPAAGPGAGRPGRDPRQLCGGGRDGPATGRRVGPCSASWWRGSWWR
jgi:hypothetical protein